MSSLKTCDQCAIYIPEAKTCQFMPSLQGKINPNDYCSQHRPKGDIVTCEYCGQGVLEPIIEYEETQLHIMCPDCYLRKR